MRGVFMSVRKLGFWGLALALVLSFLAAGPASANEEDWGGRAPKTDASAEKKKKAKAAPKKAASTEKAKTKTKGKAVSKSTKAKSAKPKTKAKAKTTAKTKVAKARRASPPKSHFPTQTNAGAPADHPAGLPELSNEQKDDLPPPQNTEPQE